MIIVLFNWRFLVVPPKKPPQNFYLLYRAHLGNMLYFNTKKADLADAAIYRGHYNQNAMAEPQFPVPNNYMLKTHHRNYMDTTESKNISNLQLLSTSGSISGCVSMFPLHTINCISTLFWNADGSNTTLTIVKTSHSHVRTDGYHTSF